MQGTGRNTSTANLVAEWTKQYLFDKFIIHIAAVY